MRCIENAFAKENIKHFIQRTLNTFFLKTREREGFPLKFYICSLRIFFLES